MTPYGKLSQAAIAAASYLAEHYSAKDSPRFNSRQIGEQRNLSQAIVAKVLTMLSQAGIVTGSPGPGGGYALAREPNTITLHQIVALFDRYDASLGCPFGEGWCGTGPQCPLHTQLDAMRRQLAGFLQENTLERFSRSQKQTGQKKASSQR